MCAQRHSSCLAEPCATHEACLARLVSEGRSPHMVVHQGGIAHMTKIRNPHFPNVKQLPPKERNGGLGLEADPCVSTNQ